MTQRATTSRPLWYWLVGAILATLVSSGCVVLSTLTFIDAAQAQRNARELEATFDASPSVSEKNKLEDHYTQADQLRSRGLIWIVVAVLSIGVALALMVNYLLKRMAQREAAEA